MLKRMYFCDEMHAHTTEMPNHPLSLSVIALITLVGL